MSEAQAAGRAANSDAQKTDSPDHGFSGISSDKEIWVLGRPLTDCDEGPGQWPRNDRGVDEPWIRMVAEGQRAQVEEVDNQDELSPDEVAANEEHDEGEVQQVVRDEVGTDGASRVHLFEVAREEVHNIADLGNEQDDAGIFG